MFFFQSRIVYVWRVGLVFFLVAALPSSLGHSEPTMGMLRPTYDSVITPINSELPLKPSLHAQERIPLQHERDDAQNTKRPLFTPIPGIISPEHPGLTTTSSQPGEPLSQGSSSASFLQIFLSEYYENAKEFPKIPQKERAALYAFYDRYRYELLWSSPQGWTQEAQHLITTLRNASHEGLKPSDYRVPSLSAESSLEDRAKADVALSAALVSYARDARGARFSNMGISPRLASPASVLPSVEEVLSKLHHSGDGSQILVDYNPTTIPFYLELRQALAYVRSTPKNREEPSCIPSPKNKKKCLKTTKRSPQHRAEGKILANMERLRWLPPRLGAFYVMVNVPTFNASIVSQGQKVLTSRVVVGKQATRTPLLSSQISSIVVNPTWYVPASIAREIGYGGRGYKVRQSKYGPLLTQPPGERNALGRLKLIFSSPYGIYMHDTPGRHLFSAPARAFSHGCIRLDNPVQFASSLLAYSTEATEEKSYKKLSQLIGTRRESSVALPNHVSIYVTYITVRIEGSDVVLLGDIYGYDSTMIARLI